MIPYGYKQTEVGVIPEDWTVDTIGAVTLSVTNGGNYKNSTQISLYPLIKMGNISRGYINLKKIEYVIDFSPSENDRLTYGDVLLNTRNTPELVGKVAIWKNELSRAYFNSNLLRFNFKLEKSDPFFMNLIFNTEQVISEFRNIAKGTTSVAAIYPQDMLKVKIIIPPLQEQQRIAEALSDVDGMISSLEKLVAKYKSIKTACLQQMFPQNGETVPRMRLPEFTGAWEQRKAKEICSIGTGKSNTQDQVDDGKYPFYIRSDVPVRSNKYLYDCEAVITIGDGNIGKVFHYVNGKFDLHQRCYKMTDFKDIWGKYFFYYFSTKFYDRAMKMTAKATVDSVRLEMISEMDIKKPPQISEQKQIAEFFANLDNLITLHQRKLEKVQKIKQGMMQQLLTGKIRLTSHIKETNEYEK